LSSFSILLFTVLTYLYTPFYCSFATQRTPKGVLFALVAERVLTRFTTYGSRRRRREWVGKQKRHGAVFLCGRNRQIKELKKQSAIATRNDYDLVEGKSRRRQIPPPQPKTKAVHWTAFSFLVAMKRT